MIVILILAREFLVTSLRLIASGKGIVIAADKWGKYKTATTMVWICYALLMTNFIDTMSIGMQSVCTGIHIALMIDLRSVRRVRKWGFSSFERDGVQVRVLSIPLGNIPKKIFYPIDL